ncbi:UDP-N-acetylmuramoylalanine--D-glutamate ligase [Halothece sp. PCC 7418]|uniref:UDP-N-acetylmuramoyl-L-alanine--D-glutamate ligase n=1 Tax=Halothece sp. (strain PCC 7418) TaxID=65093 RepID=UPI0002A084EB|nr:UDP-N-acetylmuramoyl-L-alanine--D-glutamate ligase [Halothece sp. PCC 7418]AFZ43990.1 UDP-N-acetylmuramoylalanine--D-glutamate ligase [Halothece sp. PCC 7418]
MKAYVIGLGRSGVAAARLLKQQGWDVMISDRGMSDSLQGLQRDLAQEEITVKLQETPTLDNLKKTDLIIVSPGVPWDVPILVRAREENIPMYGEIELAWRSLSDVPWVGITGTNGKTTTTALCSALFQGSGLNAPSCGNIGNAACELGLKETSWDWIIAEISSYQIESSQKLAPEIGVWTTFSPDHLERHYTLENYFAIKKSLLDRAQLKILNGDDPYLRYLVNENWSGVHWTSIKGKDQLLGKPSHGIYLEGNEIIAFGEKIIQVSEFPMAGDHNLQNLLLAVGAARLAGVEKSAIAQSIINFQGVPHRLEPICKIENVPFINDSKATNYEAATVGLSSVPSPVILIAGGQAKTGNDQDWCELIKNKASVVLLIGEAAPKFAQRLDEMGYTSYQVVETMENAVKEGINRVKKQEGSVVLLSPACASFDQYDNFEQRGDHFRQLCLQNNLF